MEEDEDEEKDEREEEKPGGLRDFAGSRNKWKNGRGPVSEERRNVVEKRKSEKKSGRSGLEERSRFFLLDLVYHLERTGRRYQVESQGRPGPSNSTATRTPGNLRTSTKSS